MDKWENFKTQLDFKKHIQAKLDAGHESFRFCLGPVSSKEFFFNQAGFFFKDFIYPMLPTNAANSNGTRPETVLGFPLASGFRLVATHLYQIKAEFLRQGDLVQDKELNWTNLKSGLAAGAVALSQTCVIEQTQTSICCPFFYRSEFSKNMLAIYGKEPNPSSIIWDNRIPRFIYFPAIELLPQEQSEFPEEGIVLDLGRILTLKSDILNDKTRVSLTMPANLFLMNRFAQWMFRDVEGWDDHRRLHNYEIPSLQNPAAF